MSTDHSISVFQRSDADTAWKEMLRLYLEDFFEFFWPKVHADIDWSKPYELLEQELQVIGNQDAIGKKFVDKLFKVFLKTGREQWVLLHCEFQNTVDPEFSERMLIYFYRIFDRYKQDVASFAILADSNSTWRPTEYQRQIWGSQIIRTYEVIKLMDFSGQETELLSSQNPFALVVLAQLSVMQTRPHQSQRLMSKLKFIRFLLKHGWDVEKRRNMYLFLDNLLNLSPELEVKCVHEMKQIEEELHVNLTSTAERHGFERGMQQGEATLLIKQLEAKFTHIPSAYLDQIQKAAPNVLSQWGVNLMTAKSLADVFVEH